MIIVKKTKEEKTSNIIIIGAVFSLFCILYSFASIMNIHGNKEIIKKEVKRQIELAGINEDNFIYQSILSKIERENITVSDKDIEVYKTETEVIIKVRYVDYFSFFGVNIKKYNFLIEEKKDF